MCGIVGFTGNRQAAPILLDGLSKLEYRGYDSAGLAVRDGEALAQVVKAKGRLSNLIEKTDNGNALKGTCGILTSGGLAAVSSSAFAALYSAFGRYDVVHIHAEGPAFFAYTL